MDYGYIRIRGEDIKEVRQESDWRLVIELKDGRKLIVESDIYPEIRLCNPSRDDDACYVENTRLLIYEEGESI